MGEIFLKDLIWYDNVCFWGCDDFEAENNKMIFQRNNFLYFGRGIFEGYGF